MENSITTVHAEDSKSAVDQLHSQLAHVLEHMRENVSVDPALIALAEAHSSQLLDGFRKTFIAVEEVEKSGDGAKITKRMTGKQQRPKPILPKSTVKRARFMTKRAPKDRTLGDFFMHATHRDSPSDPTL
jgi:hypothetical protein